MFDLELLRAHMRAEHVDAWLMADFRGNNPLLWQALGRRRETTPRSANTTSRNTSRASSSAAAWSPGCGPSWPQTGPLVTTPIQREIVLLA